MEPVTCKVELVKDDGTNGSGIPLPFDPKEAFGRIRAPVVATVNGHTFRTTICSMGGCCWIPVSKANREGAGIAPGDRFTLSIALDTVPRTVTPPADLKKALATNRRAKEIWDRLSYTHRREYVQWIEEAKKPKTGERCVSKTIEKLKGPE